MLPEKKVFHLEVPQLKELRSPNIKVLFMDPCLKRMTIEKKINERDCFP